MKVEAQSAKKAKRHNVYKNSKGERVPSVTTITGVLNKPALVGWANRLGLQGIDSTKYVDDLAQIGSLAHYMVECHIETKIQEKRVLPETSDYSNNQIESALICYNKFVEWEKKHNIEYLHSEIWLVSDLLGFGGCLDCLAIVNGKRTLLDLKTCSGIYKDHFLQVAGGYGILARENNMDVDEHRIIRIGRSDDEGIEAEDVLIPDIWTYQHLFHKCLQVYNLKKELKWR